MIPYYQDDAVTIYHGDCRELAVADVDAVITDPPYGVGRTPNGWGKPPGKFEGQTIVGDAEPFDPRPLLSYGRCVLFGANYFAHLLPPGGWVVWSKVQDNRFLDNNRQSLAEVAWTNCFNRVTLFNCFWAGSPVFRSGEERMSQLHPTQKPVALMRYIVGLVTKPGDLVYDPYMGSGPVARACADLGRRYVGVELVEEYCEAAVHRLDQGVLDFGPVPARPVR